MVREENNVRPIRHGLRHSLIRIKVWVKPYTIVFSVVAFIFSMVAIGCSCWRSYSENDLGFDYMGVIVGVLALLVTVLLGWNIYMSIENKEIIKREIGKENKRELKKIKIETLSHFIQEETTLALYYSKEGDWLKVMAMYKNTIYRTIKLIELSNDYRKKIDSIVDVTGQIMSNMRNFDDEELNELDSYMNVFRKMWNHNDKILPMFERYEQEIVKNKRI